MFRVIIAGGRDFKDYPTLHAVCDHMLQHKEEVEIVSGAYPSGADELGRIYAIDKGYPYKPFPPDWDKYGKAAGPIRNRKMAEYAEAAIVFWDGKSDGSKDMIFQAKLRGLKLKVFNY